MLLPMRFVAGSFTCVATLFALVATAHAQDDAPGASTTAAAAAAPNSSNASVIASADDPTAKSSGSDTPATNEPTVSKPIDAPPPSEPSLNLTPKPKPPPYSLPWQLRPVLAPTVIRSDNTVSAYEDSGGRRGATIANGLTGSVKIPGTGPEGPNGLAIIGRLMMVDDEPPNTPQATPTSPKPPPSGLAVVNPLLGAAYAMKHGKMFRSNFFLGFTIPVGMGGGDSPDKGAANARSKGVAARAAFDNALFAVNDFTVIPGASFAFVQSGFTAQVEATLFQLSRVRGENVQFEKSKTNFTAGAHVGYFFTSFLSVGSDVRYQRWINAPFAVENDKTGASKDNLTVAIGPRFHINAGGSVWIRPGIAYWRGLDKPLASSTPNYNSVQLDIPVLF
jgi:hypothetical protein